MPDRTVRLIHAAEPTLEGAGVRLRRAFGHGMEELLDPFLMMDDFRGDHPSKYERGFPWHPHRGIETITYMLDGECDHGDSLGNAGTIRSGDVQWMTAGSGIIHQEMPRGDETGCMGGFQLWANLPAAHKMRGPRYQGIESADIPEVEAEGARIRVIAGRMGDVTGPVVDVTVDPEYLDVTLDSGAAWSHDVPAGHTVFAYLFRGEGRFGAQGDPVAAEDGTLILFTDGDRVAVTAGDA
ncbi:MAG: pirin family protein, partial [Actinobacteria bacterium]